MRTRTDEKREETEGETKEKSSNLARHPHRNIIRSRRRGGKSKETSNEMNGSRLTRASNVRGNEATDCACQLNTVPYLYLVVSEPARTPERWAACQWQMK